MRAKYDPIQLHQPCSRKKKEAPPIMLLIKFNSLVGERRNSSIYSQTYGYLYISKTNISNVPSKNMTAKDSVPTTTQTLM